VRLILSVFWNVTLVIISIETYCLMARYLKGECTVEEQGVLTELLSINPDLRLEYETFQNYFRNNGRDKTPITSATSGVQKKFGQITKKLIDEGILDS
jgi:hypothetical protein